MMGLMGAIEDTMSSRDTSKPATNICQYRMQLSGHCSVSNGKEEVLCNLLLSSLPMYFFLHFWIAS